ncbi:MAG: hypothetical protein IIA49_15045 [Bacteroidetes bacterium]|nr:hypothetical protein [Bacteroidota bacterium]
MIDLAFITIILIYLWISIKVENWITIFYLGFKTETPLLFLKYPQIYDIARIVLILLSLFLAFYSNYLPFLLCLFITALVWVLSGKIGRANAFNKYREISLELAEDESDESQKAEYLIESKRSNNELQDFVTIRMKNKI